MRPGRSEKNWEMRHSEMVLESLTRLGLPRGAGWEEVQARYRKLVLRYHPDVNSSNRASERFRQIASAYEALAALRRRQRARSTEELARVFADPKIRGLTPEELALRMQYSSSSDVRATAAYLLGKWGGMENRRILLQAGRDSDDTVRLAALESLAEVGVPGDLIRFIPLLGHPDRRLAKTLFRSARRIWRRRLKSLYHTGRLYLGNKKAKGHLKETGRDEAYP